MSVFGSKDEEGVSVSVPVSVEDPKTTSSTSLSAKLGGWKALQRVSSVLSVKIRKSKGVFVKLLLF